MTAAIISVLLGLLTALVEVQPVTFPYISFMGIIMSNHSYINLTLVGNDASSSVQCHTAQHHNRGSWYFPSGPKVTQGEITNGIFQIRGVNRADLRRGGSSVTSGIYHCEVGTNAIFVGLFTSGGQHMFGLSISVRVAYKGALFSIGTSCSKRKSLGYLASRMIWIG